MHARGAYDLVIADVELGPSDVWQAIRAMRASIGGAATPLIGILPYPQPEIRLHAHTAGCDDVFTKPFDLHELARSVRALLEAGTRVGRGAGC